MEQNLWFIFIICAFILALLFALLIYVITYEPPKKWRGLLDSRQATYQISGVVDEDEKKKKKKANTEKKSLKQRFKESKFYKKWSEKMKYFYWQSGDYTSTFDDFLAKEIKYTLFGVAYFCMAYYMVQNVLIALLPALTLTGFMPLKIYSNITKRRSEFRGDFPFFLKTLGFVMSNGENPINALQDVTAKMPQGVLKEVMEEVLAQKTVNGGNFEEAFDVLLLKMNIDEVKDFVDTLKTSSAKGISIADTFNNQSELMEKMIGNVRNKKISNVENKILLPIIMAIASIAVLIISF